MFFLNFSGPVDMEVGMMLRMLRWRNGGGNLGTEDRASSECTKTIILFILKANFHISHCWVSKTI